MKSYYRVILGAKSVFAKECYEGNFVKGLNNNYFPNFLFIY